ncbi:MAG: hypothetical protein Q4E45_02180 [Eubacteriales bacterium]|nr:hypothetical protein [Eubacteriales bacterium]
MELERKQIKKNLLGNYRAEEVDSLLDAAEQLMQQRDAERAEAAERLRAETAEVNRLSAELRALRDDSEQLQAENRRLEEQNRKLREDCRLYEEKGQHFRSELDSIRVELEELRTDLEFANSQTAFLNNRVDRQRRELEEKDRLLMADPVGEANKRAELIVQNAMNTSKQILDDAEGIRSRAMASVRAAYFNSMGFRQELEERFATLQSDLNQSMRTLRAIESEEEFADHDVIQEKW